MLKISTIQTVFTMSQYMYVQHFRSSSSYQFSVNTYFTNSHSSVNC